MIKYFVYRLRNAETYGTYVFVSDQLELAKKEAIAHKKATEEEYGVFERKEIWSTHDQ